jgi:hypothetical protein
MIHACSHFSNIVKLAPKCNQYFHTEPPDFKLGDELNIKKLNPKSKKKPFSLKLKFLVNWNKLLRKTNSDKRAFIYPIVSKNFNST